MDLLRDYFKRNSWAVIGAVAVISLLAWWGGARVIHASLTRACHDADYSWAWASCSLLYDLSHYSGDGKGEILYRLGRARYEDGDAHNDDELFEEALDAFTRAEDEGFDASDLDYWRGKTLQELDRPKDAASAFSLALEKGHGDIALANRGWSRTSFDDQDALEDFDAMIERHGDAQPVKWISLGRGWALRGLGRHEEAVEAFERAVEKLPRSSSPRRGLAGSLFDLARYSEALEAAGRGLERYSKNRRLLALRARSLRALGRLDEAYDAYSNLMKVSDLYKHRLARGYVSIDAGNLDQAIKDFEYVANDSGLPLEAETPLVMLYCQTGQADRAAALMAKMHDRNAALDWLLGDVFSLEALCVKPQEPQTD